MAETKSRWLSAIDNPLGSINNKSESNHNLVRFFFPWMHIEDILSFTPANFKTVLYREIAMKDFKIKTEKTKKNRGKLASRYNEFSS